MFIVSFVLFRLQFKAFISGSFIMANQMDNITQAINEISLEDEEEGGIALGTKAVIRINCFE